MDYIKSAIVWIIGICFLGILFPLTFIIWLLAYPFDTDRRTIHWILNLQSLILIKIIPLWKVSVEGREKAVRGTTYVIISNHQSIIDILLVNTLGYRYKWISKIENMKVPVLGWYLRMADYIIINRGNEESKIDMLARSQECLNRGTSIMLFPEGTRSLNMETGIFKRGAFMLAIDACVPILPVIVDGTGEILPKHGVIFKSGFRLKVKVLDPVMPDTFRTKNPDELASRLRDMMNGALKELRNGN